LAVSCKKDHQISREKHINATIVSPIDGTTIINSVPGGSYISCGILYGYVTVQPTKISGLNKNYTAAVLITVGDSCITAPGTYNFICQYVKDYSASAITYENDSVSDRGNITFDEVREDNINGVREVYVQGQFHATCINGMDSVLVTGTFDGYFN
jgi:hypothetical protein